MKTIERAAAIAGFCVALLLAASAGRAQAPAPNQAKAPAPNQAKAPTAAKAPAKADASGCVSCHKNSDEDYLRAPAAAWPADVHAAAGLGCESCHGGDSKIRKADPDEWSEAAMDAAKGFNPAPDRKSIPKFCARCHADAAYMKRFNPSARVDQYAEYLTSVHGKLNAKGDPNPATCVDCHGTHGIRPVSSPQSPAYSTNVSKTCAKCHADVAKMAPYKIPTTQYDGWSRSVHASALLERGDLSAPACNDCHGNHGAAPPEVKSVVYVCGHCHGREAGLYRSSIKQPIFDKLKLPECIVCHSNHHVVHPTPELFHTASGPELSVGKIVSKDPFTADVGDLAAGQKVVATWRTVLALHIPAEDRRFVHTIEIATAADSSGKPLVLDATIRPGSPTAPVTTHATTPSGLSAALTIAPQAGFPVEAGDAILYRLELAAGPSVTAKGVRIKDAPGKAVDPLAGSVCITCHKQGDSCDVASEKMYVSLSSLERELRQAGEVLHQAEVAGMEVSRPQFELKSKGITSAVEARALIHSFDPDRLLKRAAEGRAAAQVGKKAGLSALNEVQVRRKGLAVSLVLIFMVLVGLYLKIREVERNRKEG